MNKRQLLEPFLVTFALFSVLMQYIGLSFGQPLMVIGVAGLALYYLLSGALVLFDKRVGNIMRILYFIGLWSIAIGLLGIVFLLQFWPNSGPFLLSGFAIGSAMMIIMLTYRQLARSEAGKVRSQLVPLFTRLLVYPIIFLFLYFAPFDLIYDSFGEYRENEKYKEVLEKSLENPADTTLQNQLNKMEKDMQK